MIIWGISANSHDAAIAVFDNDRLLFASQTERFSKIKNDPNLSIELITLLKKKYGNPSLIVWYENPWAKTIRQLYAGQGWKYSENNIKKYLKKYDISAPIVYIDHHESHAAAGFYTSHWNECAVLIIDSIGEWDTTSIWLANSDGLKKIWKKWYPDSLGLFYSAMTQRIGLSPQEDEYILMGMAAYGDKNRLRDRILEDFFYNRKNLHKGCLNWAVELNTERDFFDIAAATQSIYEEYFENLLIKARELTGKKRIVLGGGCVLNCLANSLAWKHFNDVWIFPNPGDSGSAVGAVLAWNQKHIRWKNNYLGYDISGYYPVKSILNDLLQGLPVGVANGRAEFGPRALGNRSLLADPRSVNMKIKINDIKKRQHFRPFAPAVLEEFAGDYFDLDFGSQYMQYAVACKRPQELPAIVHVDNTARVQTVPPDGGGFRLLLEEWYEATGCPVLLNTSLNIKGQPIVNNIRDAKNFEILYNIPVYTKN